MLADAEKKHRLPLDLYKGVVSVAYTACTRNRAYVFMNALHVERAARLLVEEAARWKCDLVIYLFMPDHVHLVLQGVGENSDTYRAMWSFKQKTGYLFSKAGLGIIWQKNFYDHILRTEDDLSNHLRYILRNPVRKGLVGRWQDYAYKGSTVFDLNQWDAE
jgi:putative transposase